MFVAGKGFDALLMLAYFKFMLFPAEGLHRPPGARLKFAKGPWFDYFWTAFCPANQGRFKILCMPFFEFI